MPAGQGAVAKEGAANPAKTILVSGIVEEKSGSRIGHYKLLQQIGEGGCGVVYMAEQEEPIRRRVAFKVIKLGMDTRQVIARFEAERQALALMDHPNIAKVLDAGATETGRPYFVMELVRGIKITDYCDQNNLSTEQRLDLFIQVCHAIHHAHQKGIIHRDIKPSNILVTVNDGVPVPKVIDFGIAKATGGQVLTDKTLSTAFEQFTGTPAYMSPEQAEMSGLDIDTRSDIYALGVLLYELLTGKTPFDAKELIQAGLEGIRRIIREQEPSRPSTKISTLGAEEQTTIAKRRQVEPPKLIHQVRRDLDWIVMKCLEKDRTRRYEGASGLAQEIERHLNHEPVAAGAPSTIYRLRKFARRHRAAMAMAAVVFGLLFTGITAVLWQWRQTEAARRNAVQAEQAEARESYAAKLALATAKVESGQLSRAREILASCPPHLRQWEWYWLNNRSEAEPRVLRGHRIEVTGLAFTPDSSRLVTAQVGDPFIWRVDTGQRLTNSVLVPAPAYSCYQWLALAKDGSTIITVPQLADWGTKKRQLLVWDTATGRQLRSLTLTNLIETISSQGNRIFLRNNSDQPPGFTVMDPTTGRTVSSLVATGDLAFRFSHFVGPEEPGNCLNPRLPAVSADGRWLLTQSLNKDPGPPPVQLEPRKDPGDIIRLPLGGYYAKVVYVAGGGEFEVAFESPYTNMPSAQVYEGLRFLWTIWDVNEGRPIAKLPESETALVFAAFSPDGAVLFTWTTSFTGSPPQPHSRGAFWETGTGRQLSAFSLQGRTDRLRSKATFSSDGKRLLTARNTSPEWPVEIWDVQSGRLVKLPGERGFRFSTKAWDAASGKLVATNDLVGLSLDLLRDGRHALASKAESDYQVWDLHRRQIVGRLSEPPRWGAAFLRFFLAQKRLLYERWDKPGKPCKLVLLDSDSGREVASFIVGTIVSENSGDGLLNVLAVSDDGERFVASHQLESTHKIWLWETRTGKHYELIGHAGKVDGAAFFPDGQRIITAGEDGTARLWDSQTRNELLVLRHPGPVWPVAVSPDGRSVLTVSKGAGAVLWRPAEWSNPTPEAAESVTFGSTPARRL